MTPGERAEQVVRQFSREPGGSSDTLIGQRKLVGLIRAAVEEDRRTRPTLRGQPMTEGALQSARRLCEEVEDLRQAPLTRAVDGQIRQGNVIERMMALGCTAEALLDHIDFLAGMLADCETDHGAYERGRRDGYGQALEEVANKSIETAIAESVALSHEEVVTALDAPAAQDPRRPFPAPSPTATSTSTPSANPCRDASAAGRSRNPRACR